MLSSEERAKRLAAAILNGLQRAPEGAAYRVTRRDACTGCPPGTCAECGAVLPGDVYIITHHARGKRHLSDKAVHYLGHGLTHYETGYVYRGEPVTVDLSLDELERYLDLS